MFSDLFLLNPSFPCLGARGPSVSDLRTRRLSGKASGLPPAVSAVGLLPHLSLAASSCRAALGAGRRAALRPPAACPPPGRDPEPDLNRKCVACTVRAPRSPCHPRSRPHNCATWRDSRPLLRPLSPLLFEVVFCRCTFCFSKRKRHGKENHQQNKRNPTE